MTDRFIVTASSPSRFLLVRATADDDGQVLAEGTRTEMISLRDSILSAEPTLVAETGPIIGYGFLLPE